MKPELILVIEDDAAILFGLRDNLQRAGYEVRSASDGHQGLELARTLRPDLVLLDEPCAGVNPSLVGGISTLLKALNKTPRADGKASSFVVIEHNMDFVMDLCHRIMVMVEGQVLAIGTPDEIRANKQVLDAYLGN